MFELEILMNAILKYKHIGSYSQMKWERFPQKIVVSVLSGKLQSDIYLFFAWTISLLQLIIMMIMIIMNAVMNMMMT